MAPAVPRPILAVCLLLALGLLGPGCETVPSTPLPPAAPTRTAEREFPEVESLTSLKGLMSLFEVSCRDLQQTAKAEDTEAFDTTSRRLRAGSLRLLPLLRAAAGDADTGRILPYVDRLQIAADLLVDAVPGSPAGRESALTQVQDACNACHLDFRDSANPLKSSPMFRR